MNLRSQRQDALDIMRVVNEAYGLPNPPAWHERLNIAIRKGAEKLNEIKSTESRNYTSELELTSWKKMD